MLGLKGVTVGGAEVSGKHANFIVNKKDASCRDVMELIDFIKTKVKDNYNIDLELEIKII
jgi:UDP-N-acetylmuramate dehydrogenase